MRARPLCFVCLLFLIFQGVRLLAAGGNVGAQIPATSVFCEEKERTVIIQGQVYQKSRTSNIQILYLKNNSVPDSKLMIYDKDFTDVAIGKNIRIRGTLGFFESARNPGNFNQQLYYARQDIYGYVWCDKILDVSGETNILKESLYQLKMKWKYKLDDVLGEKNGAILSAILLGEKSSMDAEVKELYQKNGIGHILAISGLHISFIGLGIYHLIRKTGASFGISAFVSVGVLWLYVNMIGFTVSVFRAFFMLLFRIGADICGHVYDMATALLVSAAVTVAYQPLYLTDGAFYLSYGAVLGILLLCPIFESCFGGRKWLAGVYASLAVNIMLLPILLWFYYEIPTYSLFLNLVVIPLMSVLMGSGMIGSVLLIFVPPIGKCFLWVCSVVLSIYETAGKWANHLPFCRLVAGQPDIWEVIFYYLVLGFIIWIFYYGKNKRKSLFLLLMIPLLCFFIKVNDGLRVTMIDVGQGDGIFITGPSGTTYLIDGGSSDVEQVGKYRIEPFLMSQGVGTLDYVFVSHGDTDHYSGIEEMINRQDLGVKINHLILPVTYFNDKELCELAKTATEHGVEVRTITSGQFIKEGEFTIRCVQPDEDDTDLLKNAGSMVLDVEFMDFRMLCTGDVEGKGEERLLQNLNARDYDVLKVAHHGSKNSGSVEFLQEIQPEIGLISAGTDNLYGHPHEETIKRLSEVGCRIYQTKENGAITIRR